MSDLAYSEWLGEVDKWLWSKYGIPSHDDLPDYGWRDWFDDEVEPFDAATEAMCQEME